MTPSAVLSVDPYRKSMDPSPQGRDKTPDDGFSFADALDVINPLHHIPLVGWIYREISGDTLGTPAAIAGGALYGGPIGFAGAVLSAAFERIIGETPESAIADLLSPSNRAQGLAAYQRAAGLADG